MFRAVLLLGRVCVCDCGWFQVFLFVADWFVTLISGFVCVFVSCFAFGWFIYMCFLLFRGCLLFDLLFAC